MGLLAVGVLGTVPLTWVEDCFDLKGTLSLDMMWRSRDYKRRRGSVLKMRVR